MIARSTLLALSWGIFSVAPSSSYLPPEHLPVFGGPNGTAFTRSCGAGMVMTGVRFRAGLLVDAVGVLCRPVNANGTLGSETTVGTLAGGNGGSLGTRSCPTGQVVTGSQISYGDYVDGFFIRCQPWSAGTRTFSSSGGAFQERIGGVGSSNQSRLCTASAQPASAIRGRAHSLVDALGFTCNEP